MPIMQYRYDAENKNLNERLSNVRSNVDNNLQLYVSPQIAGMKKKIGKQERSKSINQRNEHLLGRIYKIFTRKRSADRGFDPQGRPMRLPSYGECSLNRQIRERESIQISKANQMILSKLQKVKPKVLTNDECKENNKRIDKMQMYMTHYQNFRSYSRPKSTHSTIGWSSKKPRETDQSFTITNSSPAKGQTQ